MKIRVHVLGSARPLEEMFKKYKDDISIINNTNNADVVVFPGGSDINPGFYGENPIASTQTYRQNDERDYAVWNNWKNDANKFFVGICRGAQFLNVMNGGKLWQDVNNHRIGNKKHPMIDTLTDEIIQVSSTHHQMMRPNVYTGEILGIAFESTFWESDKGLLRCDGPDEKKRGLNPKVPQYDPEVVWYRNTKSLCYQPHPEHGGDCESHFMSLLDKLYE
jgi:hypothetical protein